MCENCKGGRFSCLMKCNTDTTSSVAPALLQKGPVMVLLSVNGLCFTNLWRSLQHHKYAGKQSHINIQLKCLNMRDMGSLNSQSKLSKYGNSWCGSTVKIYKWLAWNKSASENQKPNSAPKKKSVALSKLTLGVDLE